MKFTKLTKKLLLSALALGLTVVTLTTTTYAWYTSSTTASAGTGTADTSSSTSDSSLLISSDNSTFGSTADLPTSVTNLIPLQWSSTKFVDKAGSDEDVATDNYYEFTLYFKTTSDASDVNLYIKALTITNTTDAGLPKFDNLVSSSSTSDGIPNESTYSVDVVNALDMVITTTETKSYELSGKIAGTKSSTGFGDGETPNANAYYDAFMGTDSTDSAAAYNGGLTALERGTAIGTIAAGEVLTVTFRVYLNGWDAYCFDACRGQSIEIDIEFSTDAA